ncbi:hypothetical protein Pcac1_g18729 [Phytophthora cactorum]|nr:hypothetical protein Pcac1_g18729 [Phytophthora cactorum]KAG2805418.1 hypothetical protein PC112_g18284 [Phytophthora cactorum]KAG2881370.1 hypothetical protein PC114_g21596 [Phytophthora cactorum]KAG2980623.1 hypothetical protein PC119_g21221 [Phytophthora cactorum]KAG3061167.1 hypothetical protein PC122_g19748 [Phytophthora cactorum]
MMPPWLTMLLEKPSLDPVVASTTGGHEPVISKMTGVCAGGVTTRNSSL